LLDGVEHGFRIRFGTRYDKGRVNSERPSPAVSKPSEETSRRLEDPPRLIQDRCWNLGCLPYLCDASRQGFGAYSLMFSISSSELDQSSRIGNCQLIDDSTRSTLTIDIRCLLACQDVLTFAYFLRCIFSSSSTGLRTHQVVTLFWPDGS
jgi:hypothetical protein